MKALKGITINGEWLGTNIVINGIFKTICDISPVIMQEFIKIINQINDVDKNIKICNFEFPNSDSIDIEFQGETISGIATLLFKLNNGELELVNKKVLLYRDEDEDIKEENDSNTADVNAAEVSAVEEEEPQNADAEVSENNTEPEQAEIPKENETVVETVKTIIEEIEIIDEKADDDKDAENNEKNNGGEESVAIKTEELNEKVEQENTEQKPDETEQISEKVSVNSEKRVDDIREEDDISKEDLNEIQDMVIKKIIKKRITENDNQIVKNIADEIICEMSKKIPEMSIPPMNFNLTMPQMPENNAPQAPRRNLRNRNPQNNGNTSGNIPNYDPMDNYGYRNYNAAPQMQNMYDAEYMAGAGREMMPQQNIQPQRNGEQMNIPPQRNVSPMRNMRQAGKVKPEQNADKAQNAYAEENFDNNSKLRQNNTINYEKDFVPRNTSNQEPRIKQNRQPDNTDNCKVEYKPQEPVNQEQNKSNYENNSVANSMQSEDSVINELISLREELSTLKAQAQNTIQRPMTLEEFLEQQQASKESKVDSYGNQFKILTSASRIEANVVDNDLFVAGNKLYRWGEIRYLDE